ncbi:hypothetical protein NEOLEDRAFT_775170 [Neolentinus lepideus HHB14362 ss-1]|uniref:Uncharacterized protein n=1 Tax=Neolentinus lepideus HHB14362 ss-1 TaxID=1314782 RepID=A0A165UV60_9AGAM|nr:hypothetical protein NEOLEDRAFT_775170 [Neolentinus lepideus HHB14362 ss-1]
MRESRRKVIEIKVREAGLDDLLIAQLAWGERAFADHPLVSQPRELTDRIWNNIKPSLVQFLQEKAAERAEEDRINTIMLADRLVAKVYEAWVDRQSRIKAFPSAADVCMSKGFSLGSGDPEEATDNLYAMAQELPRLVDEWRQDVKLELCKLLPALPEDHSDGDNAWKDPRRLELATTIFRCQSCRDLIHYPRVLVHSCMTDISNDHRDYIGTEMGISVDDITRCLVALRCEPWNYDGDKLVYDEPASELARSLVEACGLFPDTTIKDQMDELNARFTCLDSMCADKD